MAILRSSASGSGRVRLLRMVSGCGHGGDISYQSNHRHFSQLPETAVPIGHILPTEDNYSIGSFFFHKTLGYRGVVVWSGLVKQRFNYPALANHSSTIADTSDLYHPHYRWNQANQADLVNLLSDPAITTLANPPNFDRVHCRSRIDEQRWFFALVHRDDAHSNDISQYACQSWTPGGVCSTADYLRHDELQPYEPEACENMSNSLLPVLFRMSPTKVTTENSRLLALPTAIRLGNELDLTFRDQLAYTVVKQGVMITVLPMKKRRSIHPDERNEDDVWTFKVAVTYMEKTSLCLKWEYMSFTLVHVDGQQEHVPLDRPPPLELSANSCKLQFYQELEVQPTVEHLTGMLVFTTGDGALFFELPCCSLISPPDDDSDY
eukprot:m.155642 g.155642  ORF g.155642 m.155642 type:complete len:378 (+) comp16422_c0_seq5:2863-3996(+)